ncbi:MAG TPA: efflux RND transporter periplasmic adaptor subunit [Candidatus Deferrimicrobium sp.]|nr:efflux RND transporter periplasmic adaptor subunit [Candidatus Deferrimicrobium sp.]
MKRKKKWLLIIGGAVVVIVIVVLNLSTNTTNAVAVQADVAKTRDLVEKVSASGRVQPQTKVDITSEINGEIIGLYVQEGDQVKTGDLLVVLDTVQLRTDVDQADYAVSEINARLAGAETALEQAKEEYDRQQRLFDNNLTSETMLKNGKYAYLNAKSAHEATKAQAQQLHSQYDKQLDRFSKAKILAPMPGIVTYLDCEVGEVAAAQTAFTQGKTLMTISNLDVFEVEVEVDETEVAKVEVGQEVEIEVDAFQDTTFKGQVVEIGNTAIVTGLGTQDQSTNFKVKVIFQDPNVKIRPGMSATVDITTSRRDDILCIPYGAVVMRSFDMDSLSRARHQDSSGQSNSIVGQVHAADSTAKDSLPSDEDKERKELKGVFTIKDGKVRFIEIETGIADEKNIEVTSGLVTGDSLVSGPYRVLRNIKEGDVVEVEKKREMKGRDAAD